MVILENITIREVTLNPSDVNTSSDASVKTTFTFPAPVYIQDKVEYAFVILSNSNEYNCYVGRLGETNIGSNRTISSQPYAVYYLNHKTVLLGLLNKMKILSLLLREQNLVKLLVRFILQTKHLTQEH